MQLIYDFKDGSGTFGYISVDLNKDPELTKSLRLIGVDIPNDMRYQALEPHAFKEH